MSDVNILLLGETGTGKSTFVNALSNYLRHQNMTDTQRDIVQLAPTVFEVTNADGVTRTISTGVHANEVGRLSSAGVLATQNPSIYNITYDSKNYKIIDTPGMGDTRGIAYDELNLKKVFKVIGQLKHLNAICIVLKPNDSRTNAFFTYCINNIFSQLHSDLHSNVIFLFTNCRGSHFTPGETSQILKTSLGQMESSGIRIPFKRDNTFCVDNETFQYLVAKSQGVEFPSDEIDAFNVSWVASSNECKRLLRYCATLVSSPIQAMVSVRDSRVVITKMAAPLIETMILHEKSIGRIKVHKDDIRDRQNSIEDLKTRLYLPIIQYKITKKIVTDSKSGTKVKLGGFFGNLGLNIGGQAKYENVTKTHTEEYIEPYETQIVDANISFILANEKSKLEIVKEKLDELETMQTEYDEELKVIVEAAAKFVTFLNENVASCRLHEDPFQLYIEQVLEEEIKCNGSDQLINNLESLLTRYKLKRRGLSGVTADDIQNVIRNLLRLNHAGPEFRRIYNRLLD